MNDFKMSMDFFHNLDDVICKINTDAFLTLSIPTMIFLCSYPFYPDYGFLCSCSVSE